MLKLLPINPATESNLSKKFTFLWIISINLILLIAEIFISRNHRNYCQFSFLALAFKFSLSFAIILRYHTNKKLAYTSIISEHENAKSDEYYQLSIDFFKLAANFSILIIWSAIYTTFFSDKYHLLSASGTVLLYLIIIMRWNSLSFLKNTLKILKNVLTLSQKEGVTFGAILVADVLTSFAKPSAQLVEKYSVLSIIIYG